MPPPIGCPNGGPPSPEVTGAFCRVPSTSFSQAPRYALPAHLCRFRVRSCRRGYFLEHHGCASTPLKDTHRPAFVTTARLGTIHPIPIDYGFRPRLRGRLTLGGLPWPRNPWAFGESVSHTLCRYSCQHSHFRYLQSPSRDTFTGLRNAPLPCGLATASSASVRGLSPGTSSARDGLSRPVSYYAFFKGWLLLSQPPGCLGLPTSFPTEPQLRDLSWRSGLFPSRPRTLAPMVCLPRCTRRYSEFG